MRKVSLYREHWAENIPYDEIPLFQGLKEFRIPNIEYLTTPKQAQLMGCDKLHQSKGFSWEAVQTQAWPIAMAVWESGEIYHGLTRTPYINVKTLVQVLAGDVQIRLPSICLYQRPPFMDNYGNKISAWELLKSVGNQAESQVREKYLAQLLTILENCGVEIPNGASCDSNLLSQLRVPTFQEYYNPDPTICYIPQTTWMDTPLEELNLGYFFDQYRD